MSNTIPGIKYELNGESFMYETFIPTKCPDGSKINRTPATAAFIAVISNKEIEVNRTDRFKERPICLAKYFEYYEILFQPFS